MSSLNYNSSNKHLARVLRSEGTKGEAILWKNVLKAKKLGGYQFNRQFLIGDYIVDFICRKLKLIIEVDGSSHLIRNIEDREREDELTAAGYTVVRFTESEIIHRLDDVYIQLHHTVLSLQEQINNNE